VDGTKNVVEASIAEGVEAVVILSTMYVLGHPSGVADETAPYLPTGGVYGTAKAEMERWCLKRAKTCRSTRVVLLLPTCVYGPRGRTYTELPVSLARDKQFCWIDGGSGIANVVYVENLVDAMILAATAKNAHGQRFIINDECLSWHEFLSPLLGPWLATVPSPSAEEFRELVAPSAGPGMYDVVASIVRSPEVWDTVARTRVANQLRPVLKKYVPSVSRLRREASAGRSVAAAFRKRPPSWLADVYGPTTTRFSSERARRILRWSPVVARETAMAQTLEWLRQYGLHSPDFVEAAPLAVPWATSSD
jgi:nucleoside-diphosphate-sugar epimerase